VYPRRDLLGMTEDLFRAARPAVAGVFCPHREPIFRRPRRSGTAADE